MKILKNSILSFVLCVSFSGVSAEMIERSEISLFPSEEAKECSKKSAEYKRKSSKISGQIISLAKSGGTLDTANSLYNQCKAFAEKGRNAWICYLKRRGGYLHPIDTYSLRCEKDYNNYLKSEQGREQRGRKELEKKVQEDYKKSEEERLDRLKQGHKALEMEEDSYTTDRQKGKLSEKQKQGLNDAIKIPTFNEVGKCLHQKHTDYQECYTLLALYKLMGLKLNIHQTCRKVMTAPALRGTYNMEECLNYAKYICEIKPDTPACTID